MATKFSAAMQIAKKLKENGYMALFAGGIVRDSIVANGGNTNEQDLLRNFERILEEPEKDIDIATSATPAEVEALFKRTADVGKHYGVILVIIEGIPTQVTTFRKEGPYSDGRHPDYVEFAAIQDDVSRRDFTVNGLMFDPVDAKLIDLVGGVSDIRKKLIRTIGKAEERFSEDYLRMLRAIRFSAQLGFRIEQETLDAIKKMHSLINKISAERIRDEFKKIICSRGRVAGLKLLDETGLMKDILPEIEALKGVTQQPNFHPEGDVFVHSMLAMEKVEDADFPTLFATLLHDIGKKKAWAQDADGRITFYHHEKIGADMALEICRRLRISSEDTRKIHYLILNHLRIKDVFKMKESTLKRFIAEEFHDDLLKVCRADIRAAFDDLAVVEFVEKKKREFSERDIRPEPLVTGKDLIEAGFKPGPLFAEILREVEDMQLEGKVKTKEEALAYIMSRWRVE